MKNYDSFEALRLFAKFKNNQVRQNWLFVEYCMKRIQGELCNFHFPYIKKSREKYQKSNLFLLRNCKTLFKAKLTQ